MSPDGHRGPAHEDARDLDPARVLVHEAFAGELEEHFATLAALGGKAGPVGLQCPWFNGTVFRGLGAFLDRLGPFLAAVPAGFRYVVEVRNRGWGLAHARPDRLSGAPSRASGVTSRPLQEAVPLVQTSPNPDHDGRSISGWPLMLALYGDPSEVVCRRAGVGD